MADAPGPIRRRHFNNAKIQPARVKRVIQADEDIGRMSTSVPAAVGKAMEHFAEKFLLAVVTETQNSKSRTVSPVHMKLAMMNNPHFAFLKSVLGEIAVPGKAGNCCDDGDESRK